MSTIYTKVCGPAREAREFLTLPDDEFEVAIVRGVHREKVLEELMP